VSNVRISLDVGTPSLLSANAPTSLVAPANKASEKVRKSVAKAKADSFDLRVQALTSIVAFAELIEFQGGWHNFSDCHTDLAEFLTKPQLDKEGQNRLRWEGNEKAAHLRRLVLMPRGHLKSTIGTTLYTLWRLYRNPELRIFVGSKDQKLSFSFIREMRQWLENEELQNKVWNNRPHIEGNLIPAIDKRSRERNRNASVGDDTEAVDRKLIWNNTALQVMREGRYKEPSVFAGSVGASITGQHYDLVIMDDVIDFKNTESEVKKQRVEDWILDIESVINPWRLVDLHGGLAGTLTDVMGGEFIVSGTRYTVDDFYGQVLEKADDMQYVVFSRNIYKNGTDASGGYLWHERYNANVERSLRSRISPRRFSSQYLNTVYEKDVHLFDLGACRLLPERAFSTRGGLSYLDLGDGTIEQVQCIVCIDPAFSAGKDGDDCAIVVGCKTTDGKTVVLDAALDRMDAAEVVKTTLAFCRKYQTLRVYHEANGVGMLVPELFKSKDTAIDGKLAVVNSHYEQRPKEAKIQGVLELPFALGNLVFAPEVWDNERINKQMRLYPAVRHDDFLDALVTLYEKALPLRNARKSVQKGIRINWHSLNVDRLLEPQAHAQEQQTLLATYNAYFK
jgi:predicted phage terminase large subunit-like protein